MIRAAVLAGLVLATGCRRRFDDLPDGSGVLDDSVTDAYDCGHTFCDNFDRTGVVSDGWDSLELLGAAGATLSPAAFQSPPNGYQVVLNQSNVDRAYLVKRLPAPTTQVAIGLRLGWASTTPQNAEVDLVALQWDTKPGECTSFGFYLVRDSTLPFNLQETYAGTGCSPNVNDYTMVLDNSGLHDFVLTITLGSPGHLKLVMDGVTTLWDMDSARPIPASTLTLKVGGGSNGGINTSAPWTITYDDLYVDIR